VPLVNANHENVISLQNLVPSKVKMKPVFLLSILVTLGLSSYSQTPMTIVNCYIRDGRVNYGHLAELLPDSIKTDLLVDPRAVFNLRDGNNILLWLEQPGWKLDGVDITG
jgi:hypothetical protein